MSLLKEIPDSATTVEVLNACEELATKGHNVVIKHRGKSIFLRENCVIPNQNLKNEGS